jgi:hypothetical protein
VLHRALSPGRRADINYRQLKRATQRKVRIGRVGISVRTTIAAFAAMGRTSGEAVRPVLNGSVTGSTGLTVAQAIILGADMPLNTNPATFNADDAVTTRSDEDTKFTIATEFNVGENVLTWLYLQNDSDADASAILELNVPYGIDVEVEEFPESDDTLEVCDRPMADDGLVSDGQLNIDTSLVSPDMETGLNENDGVAITIEPKDDLNPGFYTIAGRIVQTSGSRNLTISTNRNRMPCRSSWETVSRHVSGP